jgi:hypothetical protein
LTTVASPVATASVAAFLTGAAPQAMLSNAPKIPRASVTAARRFELKFEIL